MPDSCVSSHHAAADDHHQNEHANDDHEDGALLGGLLTVGEVLDFELREDGHAAPVAALLTPVHCARRGLI